MFGREWYKNYISHTKANNNIIISTRYIKQKIPSFFMNCQIAQLVRHLPPTLESRVRFLGWRLFFFFWWKLASCALFLAKITMTLSVLTFFNWNNLVFLNFTKYMNEFGTWKAMKSTSEKHTRDQTLVFICREQSSRHIWANVWLRGCFSRVLTAFCNHYYVLVDLIPRKSNTFYQLTR